MATNFNLERDPLNELVNLYAAYVTVSREVLISVMAEESRAEPFRWSELPPELQSKILELYFEGIWIRLVDHIISLTLVRSSVTCNKEILSLLLVSRDFKDQALKALSKAAFGTYYLSNHVDPRLTNKDLKILFLDTFLGRKMSIDVAIKKVLVQPSLQDFLPWRCRFKNLKRIKMNGVLFDDGSKTLSENLKLHTFHDIYYYSKTGLEVLIADWARKDIVAALSRNDATLSDLVSEGTALYWSEVVHLYLWCGRCSYCVLGCKTLRIDMAIDSSGFRIVHMYVGGMYAGMNVDYSGRQPELLAMAALVKAVEDDDHNAIRRSERMWGGEEAVI